MTRAARAFQVVASSALLGSFQHGSDFAETGRTVTPSARPCGWNSAERTVAL
jgi:hypothetical protein